MPATQQELDSLEARIEAKQRELKELVAQGERQAREILQDARNQAQAILKEAETVREDAQRRSLLVVDQEKTVATLLEKSVKGSKKP